MKFQGEAFSNEQLIDKACKVQWHNIGVAGFNSIFKNTGRWHIFDLFFLNMIFRIQKINESGCIGQLDLF